MYLILLFFACVVTRPPVAPSTIAGTGSSVQVHITIDDLPWMVERDHSIAADASQIGEKNKALVKVFADHEMQVSVFFNCGRIRPGDESIQTWSKAGHTIGNHTWSHAKLTAVGATAWVADAQQCHKHLTQALGKEPTWLRYPYLDYGQNRAERDAATKGIAAFGERSAPVTVATTEWLHAYTYRKAIRTGDSDLQRRVVGGCHKHMDAALQAGLDAAKLDPGRPIPQTVLIHINELVIDEIGTLIARWKNNGVQFVNLETAMDDPVFQRENLYTGPAGLSWLWRIREKEAFGRYWFGHEQVRVEQTFGGIDSADKGLPPAEAHEAN
jgi:hypothetical protein